MTTIKTRTFQDSTRESGDKQAFNRLYQKQFREFQFRPETNQDIEEEPDFYLPNQTRDKLTEKGVQNLRDHELICLLLGFGTRDQPVKQLADKILNLVDRDPLHCSMEQLQNIKGIGQVKSASILAAIEWGRRLLKPNPKKFTCPEDVYKNIAHFADRQENLITINLNGAGELLSSRVVSRGTIDRSLVHPREVFTNAVNEQANAVIVAHNHPSGNLKPSGEDIAVTKRLQQAGDILGIEVLDHIIFSESDYYSMLEEGTFYQ